MEVCKLPARQVAQIWLKGETLYYRTIFDATAETRLTAVIQRARNDGVKIGLPRSFALGLCAGALVTVIAGCLIFRFIFQH